MLACGKCIHKNVCEFCKAMGFENVVRANDFDCKDFMSADDVVEVKHGYWITDENGIVICSECGEEHAWDEYRATYCEDCGAKMDGGNAE